MARVGCVKRILCVKRPDENPAVVFLVKVVDTLATKRR